MNSSPFFSPLESGDSDLVIGITSVTLLPGEEELSLRLRIYAWVFLPLVDLGLDLDLLSLFGASVFTM